MAGFWRRPFSQRQQQQDDVAADDQSEVTDGTLHYVAEKSGNESGTTYQEATGAPVEVKSPLGYHVGPVTIIFLNVSMMIGTGIYSTPSTILKGTGSVGLAMIWWTLGFFISAAAFAVYLEFASYFSNRSGSEVVYLEQAYPRPKWLFPTAFAFQSVILSFSSGNAIVLSNYLFATAGRTPGPWQLKGVALAGYTVAFLVVSANTRVSFWISNVIGFVKVITLLFIAITGLVVLGGHTRVEDPGANFRNSFQQLEGGTTPYGITNGLYKIVFAYAGYTNAFNMVNEVKNPIKQIRRNGFISLVVVTILYILANVAFFASVPKEDLAAAEQIAASLFFQSVFGSAGGASGLNFLIALSAFGNLVAVFLGQSRLLRECGRQGVLPFPRFWASTKPFGTPLGPYFVKWLLTIIMILAPPAGDAFAFVTDLSVYPSAFFNMLLAIGLYLVRARRRRISLPRPAFLTWDAAIVFTILVNLFLLVMPWYPPPGGKGDVSFWYATYVVTGIGIILGCGVYYWLWIWALPKLGGYRVRQAVVVLDHGAQSHKLVKVPVAELAQWDETHDAIGRRVGDAFEGSREDIGIHSTTTPEKSSV